MLGWGRTFVKDLSSVFENLDGERTNCPTCKGTGLLYRRKLWPWSRTVHANGPCWFCEGVGTMPLYGLEGFFVGRASALFRTEDLKEPVESPVKLHLCLGKYPETRCLLKSCKPSEKMQELLNTQVETTLWSVDASEISMLYSGHGNECSDQSLAGGAECHTSEEVSMFPAVMGSLDPSEVFVHYDFDIRGEERPVLQLPIFLESRCLRRKDLGKKAQWTTDTNRIKTNLGHAASLISATTREAESSKSAISQQHEGSRYFEDLKESSGISRRTRRNQIRVKAERELAQRVLWRKKLKPSNSTEASSTEPSDAGPVWSLSGIWKDLASTWIAEENAAAHRSMERSQSEATANLSAPSDQLEKQALFASLVLGLPPISNS